MTTTTNYGTWYNATGYNSSPESDIQDAISGGDTEWRERMETAGKLDNIAADFRAAVQAALPEGIWLTGDEFIGLHNSDPDYTDALGDFDLSTAIESVDLMVIVEKHDIDNG